MHGQLFLEIFPEFLLRFPPVRPEFLVEEGSHMVEGFFPGGPVVRSQDVLKKWEQEIQISLRQLSTGTQLNRFFQGVRRKRVCGEHHDRERRVICEL